MNVRLTSELQIEGIERPISNLALGTAFFSLADRESHFALLDEFCRLGGTLIDSARSYGESEAVLGEWLDSRGAREQVVLLTKCAHGEAILPSEGFEETVTHEMRQSLVALRCDHVDLYMLHRDNPAVPVARIVDRLNREVEQGRARALGVSNWNYDRVDEANAYAARQGLHGFRLVSNNLSLATPRAPFYPRLISTDAAGERWHAETGVPLLSWSSQARGFFTDRFTPPIKAALASGRDLREVQVKDPFLQRMIEVYGTNENLERLRRARVLCEGVGTCTSVQVALAWLLHKPFTVVPVVGPRTVAELHSCVEATAIQLSAEQCAWLNLEPAPGSARD
jgi:aryl-alcohol dehydrogenase-like predicted oxidoreductase